MKTWIKIAVVAIPLLSLFMAFPARAEDEGDLKKIIALQQAQINEAKQEIAKLKELFLGIDLRVDGKIEAIGAEANSKIDALSAKVDQSVADTDSRISQAIAHLIPCGKRVSIETSGGHHYLSTLGDGDYIRAVPSSDGSGRHLMRLICR